MHACYVADLLDSGQVIYPPLASVLSAFGNLVTPVRLDLARSNFSKLSAIDWDVADSLISEMQSEGQSALADAGCVAGDTTTTIAADCRYSGQHNELTVPLTEGVIKRREMLEIRQLFEDAYERKFGVRLDEVEVELVAWRVSSTGPEIKKTPLRTTQKMSGTSKKYRRVRFPDCEHEVPIIPRAEFATGQRMQGPLIIEERETTIVILPGWNVEVDAFGCIVATHEELANG